MNKNNFLHMVFIVGILFCWTTTVQGQDSPNEQKTLCIATLDVDNSDVAYDFFRDKIVTNDGASLIKNYLRDHSRVQARLNRYFGKDAVGSSANIAEKPWTVQYCEKLIIPPPPPICKGRNTLRLCDFCRSPNAPQSCKTLF